MKRSGKPKLMLAAVAALSPEEQALLAAYRTMDDRARRMTIRHAIRQAEMWPVMLAPLMHMTPGVPQ